MLASGWFKSGRGLLEPLRIVETLLLLLLSYGVSIIILVTPPVASAAGCETAVEAVSAFPGPSL